MTRKLQPQHRALPVVLVPLLFILSLGWIALTPVQAADCQLIQVTDDTSQDFYPAVDDGLIAWRGFDGVDYEIFYYDLKAPVPQTVQVSFNSTTDYFPRVHNGVIAWYGTDGNDMEAFVYDTRAAVPEVIQLSNNSGDDSIPFVDQGLAVWASWDGTDYEIFLSNLNAPVPTPIQLTFNAFNDGAPLIENGLIVWEGFDGIDSEIYYYNINATFPTIAQLTNNSHSDQAVKLNGGVIAWQGFDGTDTEIFMYDINAANPQITKLTDNATNDDLVQVSNGLAAWRMHDGGDAEIVYGSLLSGAQRITDDNNFDTHPKISDGVIVWQRWFGTSYEIFMYDTTAASPALMQITDNTRSDQAPEISGNVIVWHGYDGSDYEIYARFCGEAPAIVTHPASMDVDYRASASLSVVAQGDGTLIYQWYRGASGDTSNPVDGATSADFITPALASGASFWVRVSSEWGSADSTAAAIGILNTLMTEDFEDETAFNAAWTVSGVLGGDKVRCNFDDKVFSYTGDCAWQFKGSAGELTRLTWNRDFTPSLRAVNGLIAGDTLNLAFYGSIATPGISVRLRVVYTDGGKDTVDLDLDPTNGYQYFTNSLIVNGEVSRVRLVFTNVSTSGRSYIDDVVMTATETPLLMRDPVSITDTVPLPEAPAGFRK